MHLPATCVLRILFTLSVFTGFLSCRKSTVPAIVPVNDIIETDSATLVGVTKQVNPSFGGYYIQLPHLYASSTKEYPVLIFFHGAGQMGNGGTDLPYLLKDGIGKLMKEKKIPVSFSVDGKNYSFIVVSPQTSSIPSVGEAWSFIHFVMNNYRGDPQRLYLSGLSLGSKVATLVGARYPQSFAALLAIAGVSNEEGFDDRCHSIASANLPVWEFHNADDPLASVDDAKRFINEINDDQPAIPARLTIFNVYGHDAWTTALDPLHKTEGINVYEWMLRYSR